MRPGREGEIRQSHQKNLTPCSSSFPNICALPFLTRTLSDFLHHGWVHAVEFCKREAGMLDAMTRGGRSLSPWVSILLSLRGSMGKTDLATWSLLPQSTRIASRPSSSALFAQPAQRVKKMTKRTGNRTQDNDCNWQGPYSKEQGAYPFVYDSRPLLWSPPPYIRRHLCICISRRPNPLCPSVSFLSTHPVNDISRLCQRQTLLYSTVIEERWIDVYERESVYLVVSTVGPNQSGPFSQLGETGVCVWLRGEEGWKGIVGGKDKAVRGVLAGHGDNLLSSWNASDVWDVQMSRCRGWSYTVFKEIDRRYHKVQSVHIIKFHPLREGLARMT